MTVSLSDLREVLAGHSGLAGTVGIVRGTLPAWGLSGPPAPHAQYWDDVTISHRPQASFPIGFGAPPPHHHHGGGGPNTPNVIISDGGPGFSYPVFVSAPAASAPTFVPPGVDDQGRPTCPPGYRLACVPAGAGLSGYGVGAPASDTTAADSIDDQQRRLIAAIKSQMATDVANGSSDFDYGPLQDSWLGLHNLIEADHASGQLDDEQYRIATQNNQNVLDWLARATGNAANLAGIQTTDLGRVANTMRAFGAPIGPPQSGREKVAAPIVTPGEASHALAWALGLLGAGVGLYGLSRVLR